MVLLYEITLLCTVLRLPLHLELRFSIIPTVPRLKKHGMPSRVVRWTGQISTHLNILFSYELLLPVLFIDSQDGALWLVITELQAKFAGHL